MKKYWSLFLVVMMILSLLSGCSAGGSATSSAESSKESSVSLSKSETPFEFTYAIASKYVNWLEEVNWYPELEKRTNTNVTLVAMGDNDADYLSMLDQRMISKNFSDTGVASMSQANVYGQLGAFVDLASYIKEYAPNIQKYIDEHPEYKQLITNSDESIYCLPSENVDVGAWLFCREDMFKKAGANTQPQTLEEFVEQLKILRDYYKDVPNYYPLQGRDEFWTNWLGEFESYVGFENGISHGLYSQGYDIKAPGFKSMVEWFIMLKNEKLIDPEWLAGAATEASWEQKLLTGLGSVSYDFYTRPARYEISGVKETNPDFKMAIMPYLKNVSGVPTKKIANAKQRYNIQSRCFVINKAVEKKVPQILGFLDYLWSPEGQELVHWGIEGLTFEVKDGKKQFIGTWEDAEKKSKGETRWSFLNDRLSFPKPVNNEAFHEWNAPMVRDAAKNYFTPDAISFLPTLVFTVDEQKELARISSAIDPAVSSAMVDFVNGRRPMSEWDQFISEIDVLGYGDAIKIQQAAYDRMK